MMYLPLFVERAMHQCPSCKKYLTEDMFSICGLPSEYEDGFTYCDECIKDINEEADDWPGE